MTEHIAWHRGAVKREDRAVLTGGPGMTVWLTGLSGSGKSTIAFGVERRLFESGRATYVLDGDNLRYGLNADLGFSPEDRSENIRRVGEVALMMADSGLVVLSPVISPYEVDREAVRAKHAEAGLTFIEVFIDTPLDVCESRDPKGLYAKARAGEISGMTGIDDPYEVPNQPEVTLRTAEGALDELVEDLTNAIYRRSGQAHGIA